MPSIDLNKRISSNVSLDEVPAVMPPESSLSSPNALPRTRRARTSKPKVKTGCDNCKQRRILCDEKRPACSNCLRSKRLCPGYPPPPPPRSARPYKEIRVAPIPGQDPDSAPPELDGPSSIPPVVELEGRGHFPLKAPPELYAFSGETQLKRHRRIHSISKLFVCDGCDKSFARKDSLERHQLAKYCGGRNGTKQTDSGGTTAAFESIASPAQGKGLNDDTEYSGPKSPDIEALEAVKATHTDEAEEASSQTKHFGPDVPPPHKLDINSPLSPSPQASNSHRLEQDVRQAILQQRLQERVRLVMEASITATREASIEASHTKEGVIKELVMTPNNYWLPQSPPSSSSGSDLDEDDHQALLQRIGESNRRLKKKKVGEEGSQIDLGHGHAEDGYEAQGLLSGSSFTALPSHENTSVDVHPEREHPFKTREAISPDGAKSRSATDSLDSPPYSESYSRSSSKPFDRGSTNPTSILEPAPHDHGWAISMNNKDDDDDIQSIASSVNSISSTESSDGSLGQTGVNYIVAKFTGDPELLALYTEAGQKLTTDRFVNNNRRLLGRFYKDISEEVHTASQKEAAAFLKSRRRRTLISSNVFSAILPDDEEELSLLEEHKTQFSMLDRYLRDLDAAEKDLAADELEDFDLDGCDEDRFSDLTRLQATGEYLITSKAFANYRQRLRQFLNPDLNKEPKMQVSVPRRHDLENSPGALTSVEEGQCAKDFRVLGRTECLDMSSETYEERARDASPSSNATQRQFPEADAGDVYLERDSALVWFKKAFTDAIWPTIDGSQRIWYQCGCGEHTYIDVKELRPGGAERIRRKITESAIAARSRTSSPGDASCSSGTHALSSPPPAHLRSSPSTSSSDRSTTGAPTLYSLPNTSSSTSPSLSDPDNTIPKFLLVCINGKAYKSLPELRYVDVSEDLNDGQLLKGILEQYEQVRQGEHCTISLLIPKWISTSSFPVYVQKAWKTLPSAVRRPTWLQDLPWTAVIPSWLLNLATESGFGAPLHILDTADFVRFHLIPRGEGKDPYPSQFKPGQWPTEEDVLKYRRYLYKPVPMLDAEILTMNLWHMRKDGPHTECFWYDVVPKKLNEGLFRPPGTRGHVYGYGIRIHEKLNILLVLLWMLIALIVTGLAIAIFSLLTKDNSSAFGLGAYMVAVLAVYVPLQYEVWKRS